MIRVLPLAALILVAIVAIPSNPPQRVGPHPDGGYLLPTGWRVAPAGISVPLPMDTFPITLRLHPDGKSLFVLNTGYLPPSLIIMNTANPREAVRISLQDAWLGLAINEAGDRFYVPEGNLGTVREFAFADGGARPLREFRLFPLKDPTKKGRAAVLETDYLSDAALSVDGKWLYVANLQRNLVHAIDLATGDVSRKWAVGQRPYRILATRGRLYVSNWGDQSISVLDPTSGKPLMTIKTGDHPSDMLLLNNKLFVACGNTNSVFVHDESNGAVREQINVGIYPKAPPGSTPNALALSPDGQRLYVANADNNAVAVVTLGERESVVEGFIPTGWYPTAVALSKDGRRLFIANGKGERSYPNPNGPQPVRRPQPQHQEDPRAGYVGVLQKGSLNIVDVPSGEPLKILTTRVLANSPYRDELLESAAGSGQVVPSKPGGPTPIKHVIYVIKENRTYDQVLGDMKEGNGDPRLVLFGEEISPNHHKLARDFVLLDNFYVTADVSADGHAWSMGAIASDFTAKLWPSGYGGRRAHYDSEGEDEAGAAGGGWLFHAAIKAGITWRTFGEWVQNNPNPDLPGTPRDKAIGNNFDPLFRSFDMNYPDQKRMDRWLVSFREYEKTGEMPRLQIVRLPNDHTSGTRPGAKTPRAAMADNDLALGRMVEAVSRSRFWGNTAIFVLEDDAQNGPDHVDSHRSPAYVISAWTKRGVVDSTMYSTVSMLRTMELILGLPPLSQFDAGATAMQSVFAGKPDMRPYAAVKPNVNLEEVNPENAPLARESLSLDLTAEDRIDDHLMNEILWRAIKGDTPVPPPVRSSFPAMWVYRVKR
jgi:YVTN family beta-propeller protein